MLSYAKLWLLLKTKGMKKTDLKAVISGNTLAKLGKNETISSEVIEKICEFLDCQPGDMMEYVNEKKVQQVVEQFGIMQQVMVDNLKEKGISQEDFMALMGEALPKYMEQMYEGKNPLAGLMEEAMKQDETEE